MGWGSPFKADSDSNFQKKKRFVGEEGSDSIAVGLRILIHLSSKADTDANYNYILVKSKLKTNKSNSRSRNRIPSPQFSCFLKSCFLCKKSLSHDKDVYMYRGDQGFCSEECRERQIYMDEMRELEISTKQMIASYRKSHHGGGRCEANILQEDLRHRHKAHKPLPSRHRAIFL